MILVEILTGICILALCVGFFIMGYSFGKENK